MEDKRRRATGSELSDGDNNEEDDADNGDADSEVEDDEGDAPDDLADGEHKDATEKAGVDPRSSRPNSRRATRPTGRPYWNSPSIVEGRRSTRLPELVHEDLERGNAPDPWRAHPSTSNRR
ncbi:hypothetical protein THAOC_14978, partial [Thalassiosira oceanica]